MKSLQNIFHLGIKELRGLRRDTVMLLLVVYTFSYGVYGPASGTGTELRNASIAMVDEDRSQLSERLRNAFLPPQFQRPETIPLSDIDPAMDGSEYTFIVDVPPKFENDVLRGRQPALQVNVDATAMQQAGIGAGYIQQIASREIDRFVNPAGGGEGSAAELSARVKFNPNLVSSWFTSVMQIINNVTMLAIILAGGALVRERERGTIDHLLTMPLRPTQLMFAKVWANSFVIVVAAGLSLRFVVRVMLDVPMAGSIPLFLVGTTVYLFSATALGILLGTVARTMPQLGLLFMMVALPMNMLSGGNTPIDSMPAFLQQIMQFVPSTHYVSFSQAILYRGAGFDIVWRSFLAIAGIGSLFFLAALFRFRRAVVLT
jgi:ABC-2 type transport system permease protein